MIQGMIDDRHDNMSYYDLQQALPILQANLPPPFDLPQLADLCRRGIITPVVFYDRCLDKVDREAAIYGDYPTVRPHRFKGLITAEILNDFIYKHISDNNYKTTLRNAYIYEQYKAYRTWDTKNEHPITLQAGDPVALFSHEESYDSRPMTTYDQGNDDAITVGVNDLLFPAEQVKGYIDASTTYPTSKRTSEELATAQAAIDRLQAENDQLRQAQASQPVNSSSVLDTILDETNEHHAPDLKYAIELWLDLYHYNPRQHGEHTGNANTWIKTYTPYEGLKGGANSIDRIRDIASPLKKWSHSRAKG